MTPTPPLVERLLADIDAVLRKGPFGARARKLLRDAAAEIERLTAALTAERAAREEAERDARTHETAKYRAEERANEAVDMLRRRTEMVDAAKTGENWPCCACGFGHSATIDAHYEARCELRAQLAEHEVAALRAERDALAAQLATRGETP